MSHHHNHNHHHDNHGHNHNFADKSIKEKLNILVSHWIEHNNSHMNEYEKWQKRAKEEGEIALAEILKEVCNKVKDIDTLYKKLENLLK
jgi:hypothetical protein